MKSLVITIMRKPLDGTLANNCLEHACGALNIDVSRISTSENLNGGDYAENGSDRHDGSENWRYKRKGDAGSFEQPTGRWPANIVLLHKPGCECVGLKKVNGSHTGPPVRTKRHETVSMSGSLGDPTGRVGAYHVDPNGKETVENWICVDSCPVRDLDEQSGVSISRVGNSRKATPGTGWGMSHTGSEYSDKGGASRFYKQFKMEK